MTTDEQLKEAQARLDDAYKALIEAQVIRDVLIAQAREQDWGTQRLANALGVTRARVYQILRRIEG